MGMFDYITIANTWLPEDARRPYEEQVFQTKNLNCYLNKYDILEDGNLILVEDGEDGEVFNHVIYTGEILFYDDINGKFRDFKAWCVRGVVKEVIEIEELPTNDKSI